MSDKPLFQNSDEQEAIYAPQQLPEDTAATDRVEIDERERADADGGDTVLVPGAAAGDAGMSGTGPSTGAGTLSGVTPMPIGTTLSDEADTENE